ncbi:hypothetical protein TNCV_376381 [Trichonephila clavipes]|nr:hypothetical protein TNCV_376381 [Trichonephila clavipes]
MFDSSSYVNPTPLAHADTSRDVLLRGGTSQALNHRQFKEFLFEMESEYADLLVHNKKGVHYPELTDDQWIQNFYFMVDVTSHLNQLNLCRPSGMLRAYGTEEAAGSVHLIRATSKVIENRPFFLSSGSAVLGLARIKQKQIEVVKNMISEII